MRRSETSVTERGTGADILLLSLSLYIVMALEEVNPVVLYGRMDVVTRVQYGLMILFGLLCIVTALGPVQTEIKEVIVPVTFGITSGLWISHLVGVIHSELTATGQR
jgi:hypothetical protein